jgi:hypothetical protein
MTTRIVEWREGKLMMHVRAGRSIATGATRPVHATWARDVMSRDDQRRDRSRWDREREVRTVNRWRVSREGGAEYRQPQTLLQ